MKKILAVASGGGHWKQLMLLSPAFQNENVKYVTTLEGLPEQSNITNFSIVQDSNKSEKLKLLYTLIQVTWVFIGFRPDVIITTGAAPGLFCLFLGKLFRKRTIWIDSIANAEELSLCGKLSRMFSDKVLTQWESLACDAVEYKGTVF